MERESNPMEALCRSGCGFYGNPATDGLCSVCFKEALKKKQQPPVSSGSSASVVSYSASSTSPAPAPRLPQPDSQLPADEQDTLSRKSSNTTVYCGYSNLVYDDTDTDHPYHDTAPQDMESTSHDKDKLLEDRDVTEDREGNTSGSASSGEQEEIDAQDKDPAKDKKKKNRCAVCRKKVGLTGFECRCGGLFCSVHRYSDKHDCTFDYRELGAQEIRRNNPVVVGEKIQKI